VSTTIIDRRPAGKGKSTVNRRKFLKRVRGQVRDAVKEIIRDGNIGDIVDGKQKKIRVPGKGLEQPTIHHSEGGIHDYVIPGNKKYVQGDREERPQSGDGGDGGSTASDEEGTSEDGFVFSLTHKEFLELFFEGLELPDLVKKNITTLEEFTMKRSGFATDGSPSRLNILRTMRQARGRNRALTASKRKRLKLAKQELADVNLRIENLIAQGLDTSEEEKTQQALNDEIAKLSAKIQKVPFIDDVDLRYNRWDKHPTPTTQAVMFNIMDVSGSMGEWEKEMAKRFFMMLYLFLTKNYERVDIVFIRHHTVAKEVDEQEFFYSTETGGTLVSPALELMNDIIKERYPLNQWNVFACQASDGDNWLNDNVKAYETMRSIILPQLQYYAYIEINQDGDINGGSDLWPHYKRLTDEHDNMASSIIFDVNDIYPVFRELFEKK